MIPAPPTPDLPEPRDIPRGADGEPLGGEAKWTVYKGAHRPCDRCVKAIHEGLMHSHPQPGRRKRTGPMGPSAAEVLCYQHGERQETRDRVVAGKLASLRASTKKGRR